MNKSKLAIVSVCYNNPAELYRTVRSVALQTVKPEIHLVVDSSDEAVQPMMETICSNAGANYVWFPPVGTYDAMNRALRLVPQSSYVWFVNTSDWLLGPESLAMAMQAIEESGPGWLVGGLFRGFPHRLIMHNIGQDAESFVRRLKIGATGFPHPSTVTPVEAILSLGGFDERYQIAADYALALRLTQSLGLPKLLDFPVSQHVPGGISYSKPVRNFAEKWQARLDILPRKKATIANALSIVFGMRGALRRAGLLSEKAPPRHFFDLFGDPSHHFCGRRNRAWPLCCTNFLDLGFVDSSTRKP